MRVGPKRADGLVVPDDVETNLRLRTLESRGAMPIQDTCPDLLTEFSQPLLFPFRR